MFDPKVAAGLVLALALAGAPPALAACTIGKLLELPVTMEGLRPITTGKINGVEETFLIDSGAFYSSLEPNIADDLKLSRQPLPFGYSVNGVGGADSNVFLAFAKTLTLGGVNVPNVPFIAMRAGGTAGIFGQNVLGIGDVEYDLSTGVVRIFRANGCGGGSTSMAYWAKDQTYSVMSVQWPDAKNAHTIGEVFVNGVKLSAIFDTGAAGSVLTKAAAERAGVRLDGPDVRYAGLTHGVGAHADKTWVAPIASFKVGGEDIRNTRIEVADMSTDDIGADMLLGADFFLSHRVYVANSQHKLYFSYNGGPVFKIGAPTLVQAGADGVAAPAQDILSGEPVDADGYMRRGAGFLSRQEFDRAIADFDKAIALAPNDPRPAFERAVAHLQNHQPALAMADLDLTLKLQPNNVKALILRGGLRLAERDKTGAADLDSAAGLVPKDADERLALAGLYSQYDLFNAALGQYDLWIASHADDGRSANALNGRCWSRAMLGQDLDKALADCNRALSLAPRTPAILDSRGLVRLRRGDNDQAIADYTAALTMAPKLAWSLYGRGLAERRKGMKAEGDADIAAAVALGPKLPALAKQYGVLKPDEG